MPVHSVPTTCSLRCVFTPLKVVVVLEVLKVVMVHCLSANFFKSARLAHLLSLPYCFGFNKCLSSLFADSHWPSAATLCFNQKLLFHSARAHPCAFSFSGTCIFFINDKLYKPLIKSICSRWCLWCCFPVMSTWIASFFFAFAKSNISSDNPR